MKFKDLLDGQERKKLPHLIDTDIKAASFDEMSCAYYHLNTQYINQRAVNMRDPFHRVEAFCIEMRTRIKDLHLEELEP